MRVDISVPFSCNTLKAIQDVKITIAIRFHEFNSVDDITKLILSEKYPNIKTNDIDFDNLEQDQFSLKKHNILGFIRNDKQKKLYVVKCDICAENDILWGHGITLSQLGNIQAGKLSCSCSSSTRYTEYQNIINLYNYTRSNSLLLGWKTSYDGVYTKVRMYCDNHGKWDTTSIIDLRKGKGCPKCGNNKISEKLKNDDEKHIFQFMKTGSYHANTKFYRSEKKEKNGRKSFWFYECPLCSTDEYTKAGICEGIFESHISNLKLGKLSCRCSKNYRWTYEQRIYKIKKELELRNNDNNHYDFISISGNRGEDVLTYNCNEHGVQNVTIDSFLNNKTECQQCSYKKTGLLRRKTIDDFIQSANERHNFLYDYSKVEYITIDDKVCIIDPEYGEFWQSPYVHLSGSGHPIRGKLSTAANLTHTTDSFIEKCKKTRNDRKFDYSLVNYVNSKTKIIIIDPEHGEFKLLPHDFIRGANHPKHCNRVQHYAYIHIIYDNGVPIALKFGIESTQGNRLIQQNRKSKYDISACYSFYFDDSESCKKAESECKNSLLTGVISKINMVDGYTETTSICNINKIINIYKKWGGKQQN